MKKITLLSVLAFIIATVAFTSCNTDGESYSLNLPDKQTAKSMLAKVAGQHDCGILFPGSTANKIEKDSVATTFYVNEKDSSFTITDFPVKNLAKYMNDSILIKSVEALDNQTLKGKLLPYSEDGMMFGSLTNTITFKNLDGEETAIAFYGGYQNYSLAGYATSTITGKQSFLLYMTPGAVYVNGTLKSSALKVMSYTQNIAVPYTIKLQYNL